MSKYIIEIEDEPFLRESGSPLYKAKNFNSLVFDETGLRRLKKIVECNGETDSHKEKEKLIFHHGDIAKDKNNRLCMIIKCVEHMDSPEFSLYSVIYQNGDIGYESDRHLKIQYHWGDIDVFLH